jgi:GNAT superfamily N-acetyltransferase
MAIEPELHPFADADYAHVPALFARLEPDIPAALVRERLARMRADGWQCLGAFVDGEIVAMAGWSERCHLFSGPVLYVENVAVDPAWKGRGLGRRLMAWLEAEGRRRGCAKITLDAYASKTAARAFYERLGYDPRGVHFVREL